LTCTNCATVTFAPLVFDPCCTNNVTVSYNPPAGTCFPVNVVTPVTITASDACGNSASKVITVQVLPDPNCGPHPDLSITGPAPGTGRNLVISWPAPNAQLEVSKDLIHWIEVPGATNSPYLAPMDSPMGYYRLHYR
jgi:hypothetical protein